MSKLRISVITLTFSMVSAFVFICATAAHAQAKDVTIDVSTLPNTAGVRHIVTKNYTVRFIGINPIRYAAGLTVVASPTLAPPPPPAKKTEGVDYEGPLRKAYDAFITSYNVAAPAVDKVANQPWASVLQMNPILSPTKAKPCTTDNKDGKRQCESISDILADLSIVIDDHPNTIKKIWTADSVKADATYADMLRMLSGELDDVRSAIGPVLPVTAGTSAAVLVDEANALYSGLHSVLLAPTIAVSEIDNQASCYGGGTGETDTLTRTPLVPGVTATSTVTTKATIVCAQPFTLTAGVLVGAFGSPTYAANAPVSGTPPALVPVTEQKSPLQARTVAQLHYRILDLGESAALHLTGIGTFASSQASGNIDGGVGLSASVAEDHIFFTLGYMATTRQLARADLGPGQMVPPNTEIKTVPVTMWPVVFGIGLRF